MLLRLPWRCSASKMFADAATNDFFAIMGNKAVSLLQRLRTSEQRHSKAVAQSTLLPALCYILLITSYDTLVYHIRVLYYYKIHKKGNGNIS
ncbi:jg13508 [Pararge aegeria aegeria]|uniref:Jg13508 protein n=1 Tax=Pararge aegeria aegeria TaxID=348720 RepID=A0A8S4QTQ0_9NEOP|nr:jg13508 [Pararge aegeria aegeria]